MLHIRKSCEPGELNKRLREIAGADAMAINEVFRTLSQTETAPLKRLIQTGAWTDVALALIDLELPLWQVRRLAYDDGRWHCALSRERELPDWLGQSIEAHHADLALAILSALVEARRVSVSEEPTGVSDVSIHTRDFYETLPVDNFL